MDILKGKSLILASKSPRRHELLTLADIPHKVEVREVEEVYPQELAISEIAMYLSGLKADAFSPNENEIILAADTVVIYNNQILGKPKDKDEARQYLSMLSDVTHEVVTGFTLKTDHQLIQKSIISYVTMNKLSHQEIDYYVEHYHPLDKAGSYGIQEWIGFAKVSNINGSYANIMGLPVHEVYSCLLTL